jgi:hypothetical protein
MKKNSTQISKKIKINWLPELPVLQNNLVFWSIAPKIEIEIS